MAFADITATTFVAHLRQLQQRKSVVGIRYILDEQATYILGSALTHEYFALLADMKFSFDAQLSLLDEQAIEKLFVLANTHEAVRIIINHGGEPPAVNDIDAQKRWQFNLQKLATCENIAIKLSGWEMSNRAWQPEHAAQIIQDCILTFGDTRVMLASNFPLCLLAMSYSDLWNTYTTLPEISAQCFERITFSNAKNWYRLP